MSCPYLNINVMQKTAFWTKLRNTSIFYALKERKKLAGRTSLNHVSKYQYIYALKGDQKLAGGNLLEGQLWTKFWNTSIFMHYIWTKFWNTSIFMHCIIAGDQKLAGKTVLNRKNLTYVEQFHHEFHLVQLDLENGQLRIIMIKYNMTCI